MLSTAQLKNLTSQVYNWAKSNCGSPVADEIVVPLQAIRMDDDGSLMATIRYGVWWCNDKKKSHSVRIRFQVDEVGRLLPATCGYV